MRLLSVEKDHFRASVLALGIDHNFPYVVAVSTTDDLSVVFLEGDTTGNEFTRQ